MKTGYQVESQAKSFPAMAIAFAQDTKDFQPPNHIFNLDALCRQRSIRLLFRFAQLMQFTVFLRQNHIHRFGLQAPIAQITAQPNLFAKSSAAQLIQLVIVRLAFAKERRHDLFGFFGNQLSEPAASPKLKVRF